MRPQRITFALIVSAASLIGVLLVSHPAAAQKGPRRGGMSNTAPRQSAAQHGAGSKGHGKQSGGKGGPQGAQGDAAHNTDMKAIQFLMANRAKIQRTVVNRPDGVETLTESDDPKVTAVLVEHVAAVARRVQEQRPIHARDPLFAELFRNAATLTRAARLANHRLLIGRYDPHSTHEASRGARSDRRTIRQAGPVSESP